MYVRCAVLNIMLPKLGPLYWRGTISHDDHILVLGQSNELLNMYIDTWDFFEAEHAVS